MTVPIELPVPLSAMPRLSLAEACQAVQCARCDTVWSRLMLPAHTCLSPRVAGIRRRLLAAHQARLSTTDHLNDRSSSQLSTVERR